jgi:predicted nucleic acid-binding protein
VPNNLFLIDTSAWILALRKDFLPAAKKRVDELLRENIVITTGIIKLELLGGTKNLQEFQRLKNRLDALFDIKMNDEIWETAYGLAFDLRRNGITVPYTDILIAACAQNAKATVLHTDSHFKVISRHTGLPVESLTPLTSDLWPLASGL